MHLLINLHSAGPLRELLANGCTGKHVCIVLVSPAKSLAGCAVLLQMRMCWILFL